MRRNILFFVLILVLSFTLAPYFGKFYDYLIPQYDFSFIGFDDATVLFVAGVPFAYMFLIPFIFELFGTGNKKKLIIWSLLPVVLFYLYDSVALAYIPILASVIAFVLAKLLHFVISKFHHPNPPMVIK